MCLSIESTTKMTISFELGDNGLVHFNFLGQAFIILKTRGAAERIITELDDRCLMLSNRRYVHKSIYLIVAVLFVFSRSKGKLSGTKGSNPHVQSRHDKGTPL